MCQTLPPILLANALEAYKNADANGKKLLENLHGRNVFVSCLPIMERVRNFNDICEIAGVNPNDYTLPRNASDEEISDMAYDEEISDMAYDKIKLIVKTLNEGWKPNWRDENEYKYYPYFRFDKSAGRFSDSVSDDYTVGSFVSSRLVFKSQKLAEFAGKLFIEIYNDYMLLN